MKNPKLNSILRIAVLVALAAWAAISLGRAILQTFSPAGGNDLYTYWYAGHFIREGKDLYKAFISGELPSVPVHYLDREVNDLKDVIFPGLVPAPASTPTAFYLFTPLALLSWKTAKTVWLLINLACLGLLPFLLVRVFPGRKWLGRWEFLALTCITIGLTATRYAAASGQITFFIFDMMLAALLLAGRKPWLAGLCLGLALSKYSLSIGILLLFILIEPKLRLVLAALLVQAAGVIALLLQTGTGLADLVHEYGQMVTLHAGMEGIHLAALFPNSGLAVWIGLALTAAVGLALFAWRWKWAPRRIGEPLTVLSRAHLATILALWALLAVYHRAYDAMLIILFFTQSAYMLKQPAAWALNRKAQISLAVFACLACLLLMIPSGSVVRGFLPASLETLWGQAQNMTTTGLIAIALGLSVYFLFRLHPEQ